MKTNLKGVMSEYKNIQETQAGDHKAKWVDPYHEKARENKHVGNLKL
jgi:hypothetical protein